MNGNKASIIEPEEDVAGTSKGPAMLGSEPTHVGDQIPHPVQTAASTSTTSLPTNGGNLNLQPFNFHPLAFLQMMQSQNGLQNFL